MDKSGTVTKGAVDNFARKRGLQLTIEYRLETGPFNTWALRKPFLKNMEGCVKETELDLKGDSEGGTGSDSKGVPEIGPIYPKNMMGERFIAQTPKPKPPP